MSDGFGNYALDIDKETDAKHRAWAELSKVEAKLKRAKQQIKKLKQTIAELKKEETP